MKANIIISTKQQPYTFENFYFILSQYPTINEYEIIVINDGGRILHK